MAGDNRWDDEPWRCWVDDMIDSDPTILDKIQQWWDTTSPVPMIGSRHHTVPRRYLERFSASGQIRVPDRVTGRASLRNIKDVGAIRDFYTFINLDSERDGRLERILGVIEDGATAVIDRILNPALLRYEIGGHGGSWVVARDQIAWASSVNVAATPNAGGASMAIS